MEKSSGEIVVLTGASGCLGFHTLKLLVSSDDSVREIRCLDLREPQELMKKIISEEQEKFNKQRNGKEEKLIKWVKGDVRDINVVEQTLTNADCVIHCAAKTQLWRSIEEHEVAEFESINVAGTENLLRASIQLGVSKFIHVSSFEVYTNLGSIYYATENTLPEVSWLIFGPSGSTKKEAELKVRQYSNNKLQGKNKNGKDSLNAIIVRFPIFYGEFERYYLNRVLEVTKYLGGQLRRLNSVWVRQQPVYVGNAAWSLIKAKQCMDSDQTISGEDFHITDDTLITDPFDFVEPYVNCKGMRVSKGSYPSIPIALLLFLMFTALRVVRWLDPLGWFTDRKKGRSHEAMERSQLEEESKNLIDTKQKSGSWYDYITLQSFGFMCTTNFLNRTKASLRLNYEPIIDPEEAQRRSIDWYKNHVEI